MPAEFDSVRIPPGWRLLVQSCLVLFAAGIVNFLMKLYRVRSKFQRMQNDGLPMPPHDPVFGHLKLTAEIMSQVPGDVHGHILPHQIQRIFPDLGPMFYIDTWPFGPQMLVVAAPDPAYQIVQTHSLPKFYALAEYMLPITGGNNLVTMEGSEWKMWRSIFNPSFSSGHLMTLVPEMMKDVTTFCDILRETAAKADIVSMDSVTTKLSLDIIGRVVLRSSLNTQRSTNEFVSALRNQIRWLSFGSEANLFESYHPLGPLMRWWNNRRMQRYIWAELDSRMKAGYMQSDTENISPSKTIIDLALDNYVAEKSPNGSSVSIDAVFRDVAECQIRTFVFAGHDTTSSTICYAFHLLSTFPTARRELISEHDRVLSPDHKKAASRISENPRLLNQLPYTLAVIKETLRLYPPASSLRSGEPGYFISGSDGKQFPTDGFLVWSNHYAIQRDGKYWPEPDKFIPERWLVEEEDPLYPVKGAYRPFEHGPRNCIGQELATIEMKIVLVMTAREFDIKSVYDEWDTLHPKRGHKTLNGDRAYQILSGAAHPSDGLPCRVSVNTP